jgi:hypothetical protein
LKRMVMVCRDCGRKEEIEVYSQEEARRQRRNLVPPRCRVCLSYRVELLSPILR